MDGWMDGCEQSGKVHSPPLGFNFFVRMLSPSEIFSVARKNLSGCLLGWMDGWMDARGEEHRFYQIVEEVL